MDSAGLSGNANGNVTAVKTTRMNTRKVRNKTLNKELKRKWHSIYGQILFDRKLMEAWASYCGECCPDQQAKGLVALAKRLCKGKII